MRVAPLAAIFLLTSLPAVAIEGDTNSPMIGNVGGCAEAYAQGHLIACYKYYRCGANIKCSWQRVYIEEATRDVQMFVSKVNNLINDANKGVLPTETELSDLTKEGANGLIPGAPKENVDNTF